MSKRKSTGKAPSVPQESPAAAPPASDTSPGIERFRDRIVELRRIRAGDMVPHPKNARTHGGDQMGACTGMLVEVGKARALYGFPADGLGPAGDFSRLMVSDGHLRQKIDPDEIWPVIVLDLTRAEADKMLFGDAVGEMAGYDAVLLDSLLREVNTGCAELQQMLTDLWEEAQADALANTETADPKDAEPQTDRAAELLEKWGVRQGDLWLLGRHRLLVGDCRRAEDFARVCGGDKINVAFTSPPYASQRKYDESSGFKPIPPDEYVAWWEHVQANVRKHLADDGSFFVNIKPHCEDGERVLYVFDLVLKMRRGWGWRFVDELAWVHPGYPGGWDNRFKNGFEPVYHFSPADGIKFRPNAVLVESNRAFAYDAANDVKNKTGSPFGVNGAEIVHGKARPSNVVECNVAGDQGEHSAAFPIGLPSFFIRAFSDDGDVIADPFMGSGTTMIAAENHNRRAVGIEISPAYCAVILQRFQDAFGDQEIRKSE